MYWDQLSTFQIEALDHNIPVILPIAAIEQHGAHLPLATDRMIGEHFCRRLEVIMPEEVLILPTISVGCSEHHTDFQGSLSVTHETFWAQLRDIANCVLAYGFKNLLILNSHGGNQAIGQTFLESFGYRNPDISLAFATWWRIALEELKEITETSEGGTGHAGEFETSLMLLIAPHLVQKDKIVDKSNIATFDWAEGDMLRGGKVSLYRRMKEMTPTGVFGEAALGSKEKGEKITEAVLKNLGEIVKDLHKK